MKVILYVRVSTEEQANSGLSLEAQERKLRAYAEALDHDVVALIVDAGESAKTLMRPGMQQSLQMLADGEAEGFIVVKLDRLTRNVGDWQSLIDGYFGEKAGKALFSVSDSIDTTTAGGRLVLNVLITVAQWEREATAERTKDALAAKKMRGERIGSPRLGYRVVDEEVVEIPGELLANDMIHELDRQGLSLRAIAIEMTRRGFATKRGRTKWTHTTIAGVLRRGRYDQKKLAS